MFTARTRQRASSEQFTNSAEIPTRRRTRRTASQRSLNSLGRLSCRSLVLDSTTFGEAFLDRLHYCSNNLFNSLEGPFCLPHEWLRLESDWSDIITEELSERNKRLQSAIWELISTEKIYISRLNIIVQLFLNLLMHLKDEGDLLDVDEIAIFANITDVAQANERFWLRSILPVLKRSRTQGKAFTPTELFINSSTGTFSFYDVFKSYEKFCLCEGACVEFVHALSEPETSDDSATTANLKQWLSWCQGLSLCDQSKLENLLGEPRARLCQYLQLIAKILKQTEEEEEITLVKNIFEDCKSFLTSINDVIDKEAKLKSLMSCLEQFNEATCTEDEEDVSCDCVQATEFLRLPINTSNGEQQRYILHESVMKLVEGRRKEDVNVLIFSDVLVLAKLDNITKQLQLVNRFYFLDKLNFIGSECTDNVILGLYLDEFGLLANAFSLEVHPDKVTPWLAVFKKAKLCYERSVTGEATTYDFFKNDGSTLPKELIQKMNCVVKLSDTNPSSMRTLLP